MRTGTPKPTLGYPTQKAAIIALYEAGNPPADIAAAAGISVNSVHRALSDWRKVQGVKAGPQKRRRGYKNDAVSTWLENNHRWRMHNYRRAVQGARQAREAAGL